MASNHHWVIQRHTDHPILCWRAINVGTDETQGYGLTEVDAARLATRLNA